MFGSNKNRKILIFRLIFLRGSGSKKFCISKGKDCNKRSNFPRPVFVKERDSEKRKGGKKECKGWSGWGGGRGWGSRSTEARRSGQESPIARSVSLAPVSAWLRLTFLHLAGEWPLRFFTPRLNILSLYPGRRVTAPSNQDHDYSH